VRRSPLVYREPDFVEAADREHLLALGEAAERSGHPGSKRDATGFSFELEVSTDGCTASVGQRLADLTGLAATSTLRFRRYRSGESHPPHADHFEAGGRWLLATAMVVLRAPEAGGETAFPYATPRLRAEPAAGDLLLWLNHLRDGSPDRLSRHEGALVIRGEKVTLTSFLYGALDAVPDLWSRFDP
jgi:prolyl 4-hydroxylase